MCYINSLSDDGKMIQEHDVIIAIIIIALTGTSWQVAAMTISLIVHTQNVLYVHYMKSGTYLPSSESSQGSGSNKSAKRFEYFR